MWVCVGVSVSLCVFECLCEESVLCELFYVGVSVSVCVSVCLCVCLSVHLRVSL